MFRKKRSYKKFIYFLFLVGFFISLWLVDIRISTVLYEMAEIKVTQLATEAINNAVRTKVAEEGMLYGDLIEVHKDNEGRVVLMQANTAKINKIASDTTLAVQSALIRLSEENLYIPAGQITGLYVLSNIGPRIR
ncbi:MAG: sporulation protein YunB, partial [Desulfocucumaceae bacterium]